MIGGTEYSYDFILKKGQLYIVRLARKIISSESPFGTATGYLLEPSFPDEIDEQGFRLTLQKYAEVLGLERAFCMLDFKMDQGRTVLLELAPRPGGDCLPFLLRLGLNLDILKLFLDFSCNRPLQLDKPCAGRPFLGLRVHARKGGILRKIDVEQLKRDPRVQEIHLIHSPGHTIRMPPEDYISWLLGHIIFEPDPGTDAAIQCNSLLERLVVEVE